MSKKVISPCISICKTDPVTGFCMVVREQTKKRNCGKMKILIVKWKKENLEIIIKNGRLAVRNF